MHLYSWGSRTSLGHGGLPEDHVRSPLRVAQVPWQAHEDDDTSVVEIASGREHTLVVTSQGKIFSCGSNDYGQLGHGLSQTMFQPIPFFADYTIKSIACGDYHSVAVDEFGNVYSWGRDNKGQLGHNLGQEHLTKPKMIKIFGTIPVVQVSCGESHNLALAADGRLFVWGDNSVGQLGLGPHAATTILVPQPIETLIGLPIRSIACGANHCLVVSLTGAVYGFGKNSCGQLGLGHTDNEFFPRQLRTLRSQRIRYVACGEEHTVALDFDGGVFSFGAGGYGQLGHGKNENEVMPRKVQELMGTTVTQVACGKRHTLAYVPSRGRVYAFGLDGSGQLGRDTNINVNTPQIVFGPWVNPKGEAAAPKKLLDRFGSPEGEHVLLIGAGGDQSFAVTSKSDKSAVDRRTEQTKMKTLTPELIEKIEAIKENEVLDQDFMEELETIFNSRTCLNGSLLMEYKGPCSSKNCDIGFSAWRKAFSIINGCKSDSLQDLIKTSIAKLISQLNESPPDVEALRIFLILPMYQGFQDPENVPQYHYQFSPKLIGLQKNAWNVVEKWISGQNTEYFKPMIDHYKMAFVLTLMKKSAPGIRNLDRCLNETCLVLRILNRINVEQNLIVDYEDFYVPEVSEYLDIQQSYVNWIMTKNQPHRDSFNVCNFPFVFDSNAKSLLLQIDQAMQMQTAMIQAQSQGFLNMMFNPFIDPEHIQYLVLTVSRERLVEDTLVQIQSCTTSDLKKPLRIRFEGEEAEDGGGVRKEFFLLLCRELLDPKYGMFKAYDETRTIWFESHCFEDPVMFFLIGVLCGLAIYNFTIIKLPFPLALYKKLLEVPVNSIDDLSDLSPTVAKSLKALEDYEGDDVEDVFCLNFDVTEEAFGDVQTVELKENGSNISVTKENKKEYIDLYCDYILNKSIDRLYSAFHKGFKKVCGGRVLDLFHARELMSLVVGTENYNWEELEENAIYKNGYAADHPTIVNFWEVFHELDEDHKRKFLLFLTGSDRIPIQGMKSLNIIIQKTGDDQYLPVAHTCFNLLDLPCYATKEKLRYKLLKAIECTEGFGLV